MKTKELDKGVSHENKELRILVIRREIEGRGGGEQFVEEQSESWSMKRQRDE